MVGDNAYGKFLQLSDYSYNCIKYLMENNETVWKLLKYNDPDAWSESDLTYAQKAELIYKGQEDGTTSRVFLDVRQPDVWTHEDCIIRISPYRVIGKNRTVGIVTMSFEVYSHYKINTLSNYRTRIDTITQQFLEVFNGVDIGGLGRLYFDALRDQQDMLIQSGQIPFSGKQIFMSTNTG